jgi:hypothetical protein
MRSARVNDRGTVRLPQAADRRHHVSQASCTDANADGVTDPADLPGRAKAAEPDIAP